MRRATPAFTLIEIMVVVAIVGIMATLILPRMVRRPPSAEWTSMLDDVNNLIFFARQEAISHQKNYRLRFQSQVGQHFIVVEEEKQDPEKPAHKLYEQAFSGYFSTKYKLSEYIKLIGVYYGKKELMESNKGQGYCYVIPDGLVQDILVHLTRVYSGKESKVSLKMKPFLGKFELLDGHAKPEK